MQCFCNEIKEYYGCSVCKESCIACLDFHHLYSKTHGVTCLMTWTKLFNEMQKCIVLCCNCHRKVHVGLITIPNENIKIPLEIVNKYIKLPHRIKNYDTLVTLPSTSQTVAHHLCGSGKCGPSTVALPV